MRQMSVKPFSSRYLRWAAGTAAAAVFPQIHARMPMYRKVAPIIQAGPAEMRQEVQAIPLSAAEAEAAKRTKEGVPKEVTRSLALVQLSNVSLLGNTGAVIDEARQCLLVQRGGRSFPSYHEFRGERTTRVNKPDGNYFNMLGAHRTHRHYFHFLIDYLPRLHYLLNVFPLGREQVTVLVNEDLSSLQTDIFRVVMERHPNISFEQVPRRERWFLPRLYHLDDFQTGTETGREVERTCMSPGVAKFLRESIFSAYGVTQAATANRRFYISRNDTKKRRLTNEAELFNALERNRFEIVMPGNMSVREQATLFSQAEAICGAHGTGFTNMLFAPAGAQIIEILPANKVIAAYLLFAKSMGHNYTGLIAKPGGYQERFTADPISVAAALDAFGASKR